MDAEQALTDLTEISSQIRAAVLLDEKGAVAAWATPRRSCSPRPNAIVRV
jgi:hypothetical protein